MSINDKIEKLYDSVAKEEKSFVSSLNKALVFYLIVIIILSGYTIFINVKIKELATPTNLAVALNTKIKESIPNFARQIKDQMKPGAKQLADRTVESVQALVPRVTDIAKSQIELYVSELMTQVESDHLAAMQRIFEAGVDETLKNKDIIKDKNLGKALASHITGKIDEELRNIINNEFFNSMDKFRNDIDALRAKPIDKMTKKEYAEKMFIIYWISIVEQSKSDIGSSSFGDVISMSTKVFEDVCAKAKLSVSGADRKSVV